METLGALFLRVLTVSAGCSAVLVPLLLLSPRLQRRVAARSFYLLFLLLALRLVMPVELSLPAPAVTVPAPSYTVPLPAPAASQSEPAAAPGPSQAPAVSAGPVPQAPAVREIPVTSVLGLVWAAGAAACVLWAAGGYWTARRRLLRTAQPAGAEESALLERLRCELRLKRSVRLCRSSQAPTPLALGLFRPVVILPGWAYATGDLELILRHELTHIRRWDVAYKLVLSLACAVHWFNPLVWLMSRAAGRNLELCCDDAVVHSLPDGARRRYGMVLLDAARTARPIPFSTCFSGGKQQMKDRLLNLFIKKKNSAALVCLVLAAALLAGGLVACEKASGSVETANPENQARRALLEDYFYENYTADNTSVLLADLTGDGLDELLVISIDPDVEDPPSLREEPDRFSFGKLDCYTVRDGQVANLDSSADYEDGFLVTSAHVGWGYLYLVPMGTHWAVLDFRPYIGQGMAAYSFEVVGWDETGVRDSLDGGNVYFTMESDSLMGMDTSGEATIEEVQALLQRVQTFRSGGIPLLVYYEDYTGEAPVLELAYLNMDPADVFAGKEPVSYSSARSHLVSNGETAQFPLPPAGPATPEEALDALEATLSSYPDGWVFRVPNYDGAWELEIAGVPYTPESGAPQPVRYLQNEEWVPGTRYDFMTEGTQLAQLTLTARVTAPDGTGAERTITLIGDGESLR